ncbi:Flp family type IVb pilin [Sneathiella aquimaris]|uniref:Flp family type IVb pilin n=1 Tax=Sneathiella aquimaris TaxID=2599305 RepID=UPI001C664A96|nr:Flp family type IVb pilin [Sneathiella aquimaris]
MGISIFIENKNGATAIEYGLIASLVAIVGIVAYTALGGTITETYTDIAGNFCSAVGGSFSLTVAGDGSCSF